MSNVTGMFDTRNEALYDYLYNDTGGKIILYFNIVLTSFIGPGLMVGIVAFEMFGGDSQKRTIMNRLLSAMLINAAILSIFYGICRITRDAVGPFDYTTAMFFRLSGSFFKLAAYFFYNALTVFRFLFIVVWKRMRGIQDKFWAHFLFLVAYVGSFWCITELILSGFHPNDDLLINLTNENSTLKNQTITANGRASEQSRKLNGPAIFLSLVTIFFHFYCNFHILYLKWRQWKEEKENVNNRRVSHAPPQVLLNDEPVINSSDDRPNSYPVQNQNFHLNTVSYNKILTDMKHIICLLVFILFHLITKQLRNHFLDHMNSNPITDESKIILYVLDFGPIFLISLVFPLIFYISHTELQTYWKNAIPFCRAHQA